ncbi:interferon-related developmental regulator-domain-containing protein [Entophlyctis helioformis]|nr:interferon-related developmental regulator-domain-containing protein [Entophlyctis helioformis]
MAPRGGSGKGKRSGRSSGAQHHSDDDDALSETSSHATVDSLGSHMSAFDTPPSMSRNGSQRSVRDEPIEESAEETALKAFDDLEEKRTSSREAALRQIFRSLSNRFLSILADSKFDSWIESLRKSARKEPSEAILTNKVLSLLWITVGKRPSYYTEVAKLLEEGIRNSSGEHKASCIATLAIIAFIEEIDDADTWDLLNTFEEIFEAATAGEDVEPEIVCRAIEAYGLLYATASTRYSQEGFNRILDTHKSLLESDDVDVRIAAGENIAIIIEDRDAMAEEDEPAETEPFYKDSHELIRQLAFLSQDSNRHRAKKERATQKSAFRDILYTVENKSPPSVKLKVRHETVQCNSWTKIRRLNAFRDVVGEGLTVHFLENPLLHSIFEVSFDGPAPTKITSTERRLYDSIVGKARSKALKGMRTSRTAYRGSDE